MVPLILYSKPGCHLCEGLQEKLAQLPDPPVTLEIRDITTNEAWWAAYQYEVPVLFKVVTSTHSEVALPRPSPRLSVAQLQRFLDKHV